jgi:hypothetical protein
MAYASIMGKCLTPQEKTPKLIIGVFLFIVGFRISFAA